MEIRNPPPLPYPIMLADGAARAPHLSDPLRIEERVALRRHNRNISQVRKSPGRAVALGRLAKSKE